jgi:hypothetical protein
MSDIYVMQNVKGETNSPVHSKFDQIRWALLNPWLSEGQPDDRTPMNGSVKDSGGTTSVQRSFARRRHQAMFQEVVPSEARQSILSIWRNSVRSYRSAH